MADRSGHQKQGNREQIEMRNVAYPVLDSPIGGTGLREIYSRKRVDRKVL
jgi:hypothetical protein